MTSEEQATPTGFEPVTSSVTGKRSGQLSYDVNRIDSGGVEPPTCRLFRLRRTRSSTELRVISDDGPLPPAHDCAGGTAVTVHPFALYLSKNRRGKPLVQDSNLGLPRFRRALYRLSQPACLRPSNCRGRIRTGDFLFVGEALYQLSYAASSRHTDRADHSSGLSFARCAARYVNRDGWTRTSNLSLMKGMLHLLSYIALSIVLAPCAFADDLDGIRTRSFALKGQRAANCTTRSLKTSGFMLVKVRLFSCGSWLPGFTPWAEWRAWQICICAHGHSIGRWRVRYSATLITRRPNTGRLGACRRLDSCGSRAQSYRLYARRPDARQTATHNLCAWRCSQCAV